MAESTSTSTSAGLNGESTLCQQMAVCILMAGHAGPHQWAVASSAQAYGSEADPELGGPSPVPYRFRSTSRPRITQ